MGKTLFLTNIDKFRRSFCIDTERSLRYNEIKRWAVWKNPFFGECSEKKNAR